MTLLRPALTALALGFAALPALAQTAEAPKAPAAPATQPAAPAILPDIALGSADAPLTIFEYASFTCSHCADFHTETFPKLKADYIDTGKVRFVQRDIYFDAVGLWAGILARCGGDDKYYAVGGMLFDEQRDWISGKDGEAIAANLKKIGAKAGISAQQVDACWNDTAKVEQLVATFQKHATDDKVEATPSFVIAGEQVPNQDWDKLKAIIDAKLAEAEKTAQPAPAAEQADDKAAGGN
ncbi:thioredoxin domain-containing protein [Paracoccus jiaweipingae]|uniref:thioredoxin domain-containing protein n=1 Tax=unclassified Paracoccus (in: a-proteobacteria) TaxID=2688777 RepID=UPI003788D13C